MTLIFLTNLVNHHQIPLADEFYRILGDNYIYVAFEPLPDWLKKGGYREVDRPYIIRAYASTDNYMKAVKLTNSSDVVIIGSAPIKLVHQRIKENKVTFHYSERWFKSSYKSLFSPRAWKFFYQNHTRFCNKRVYMLCASAYMAGDASKVFAYRNKCYKWGYMTAVPEIDIKKSLEVRRSSTVKILWIARFLKWKHPERMIQLAEYLQRKSYSFEINMIGGGELFDKIAEKIKSKGLSDRVHLLGNMPNPKVIDKIREHHIFCFTSDRNEGWGAVLNEAMSNGCCPVASNMIGSAPYLVTEGENGFLYDDASLEDLCHKVEYLILYPQDRERMAVNAYRTMHEVWNPCNASEKFIKLASSILDQKEITFEDGPCSKATIIK